MAMPAGNPPQRPPQRPPQHPYVPQRTFTHEFVRAHSGLAALVEARLSAPVDMPISEREMLTAHLRLSSAVLRAVSGVPRDAGDAALDRDAQPNLSQLANICVGLLEG